MKGTAADVSSSVVRWNPFRATTWRPTLDQTIRWTGRGFWAVLDRALFALSSLILNVMLARWLSPAEYGAFVTAQTILLMFSVPHTSLLSEPMLFFGSGKYRTGFSDYLRMVHSYHWRLTLTLSAVLLTVAIVLHLLGLRLLAEGFFGLSLAAPFILLSWLARLACYAVSQPRRAALAGALNLVLTIAGATALARSGTLSVLSAQLLLAGAALAAAGWLMSPLLRLTRSPLATSDRSTVWSDHWRYGSWNGAAGALGWFQAYIFYLVLPLWGGLATTASLRALINVVMPILHSDAALVTILTPVFVQLRPDAHKFRRLIGWCIAAFSVEALIYWFVLVIFGELVLEWIYGGVYRYDQRVLMLVGVLPLLTSIWNVLGIALRARGEFEAVFWAGAASALVTVIGGLAAAAQTGIQGAVLGMALGSATQVVVIIVLMRRHGALAPR